MKSHAFDFDWNLLLELNPANLAVAPLDGPEVPLALVLALDDDD